MNLWENTPGTHTELPQLTYYKAKEKKTDGAFVIFPGGGYGGRAEHEGKGYAEYLNEIGIDAFVVDYRVTPNYFPLPLLDARRAVRMVRFNAEKYGINPSKIAVMGSSAGGHLAAMLSTYRGGIEFEQSDEIDKIDYLPNYQVLAYPVINVSDLNITHVGSVISLLGSEQLQLAASVDPILIADKNTPKAFIWHTSDDGAVNVCNSLKYGEKLRSLEIPFEMHIFPEGHHGLGLAQEAPHVAQWSGLLKNWLEYNGFFA